MYQNLTKENIKSLIATGDTSKAIDLIINLPFLDTKIKNEVTLLSNRFENNQTYFKLKIKKEDDISVELNSINYSLFKITNQINISEGVRNVKTLKKEIEILKKEISLLNRSLNAKELLLTNPIFNSFTKKGNTWKIKTSALLVGLNEYRNKSIIRLYGAINDVDLFMDTLKYRDFNLDEIKRITNQEAIRNNILKTWEYLTKKSTEGDNLIFFFSGHCWQENLVCYDSESGTENVIPFSKILDLSLISNSNVFIILDSTVSLTDIDFSKVNKSKVAILMASNGVLPARERYHNGKVYGVLSLSLREIFGMSNTEIPIVFIESLILTFFQSKEVNSAKITKPLFFCGNNFNMIFPKH